MTDVNPLYRGANDKYGTDYDTTQLHEDGHGTKVHRDYLAHVLRWGFVQRNVKHGEKILDMGCGQDLPLAQVLSGHMSFQGDPADGRPQYVGVDLNKIKKRFGAKWATILPEYNILDDPEPEKTVPYFGDFDVVVSLEVIEHMSVENGDRYLAKAREALKPGGRVYLSTPNFNGKAAKNHIHEYELHELHEKILAAGFVIGRQWGTFMSWNDMIRCARSDEIALAKELREFLGGEAVACFLASLYPAESRNVTWELWRPEA